MGTDTKPRVLGRESVVPLGLECSVAVVPNAEAIGLFSFGPSGPEECRGSTALPRGVTVGLNTVTPRARGEAAVIDALLQRGRRS